jgi:hypothetical protein
VCFMVVGLAGSSRNVRSNFVDVHDVRHDDEHHVVDASEMDKMHGVQAKEARAACTHGLESVAVTLSSKAAKFFAFVLQILKLPMPGHLG